jgi:hypothetical protein
MNQDSLEYEVEIVAITEKAVLVDAGNVEAWLPLSTIKILDGELEKRELITIEVPEWLAINAGLE